MYFCGIKVLPVSIILALPNICCCISTPLEVNDAYDNVSCGPCSDDSKLNATKLRGANDPALHHMESTLEQTAEFLGTWFADAIVEFWVILSDLLLRLCMFFALMAMCLLPFGHKRPRCDHHRASLFNRVRQVLLGPHPCRGDCMLVEEYSWQLFCDDLAWSIWMIELGCWSILMTLLLSITLAFIGLVVYTTGGSSVMMILGTGTILMVVFNSCSFVCLNLCLNGGTACLKIFFVLAYKFFTVIAVAIMSILQQVAEEFRAIAEASRRFLIALCPCLSEGTGRGANDAQRVENMNALEESLVQDAQETMVAPDRLVAPLPEEMHDATDNGLIQVQASHRITEEQIDVAIANPEETVRFGGPQLRESSSRRPPTFCGPVFAFVFSLLPLMPENMWGGLVGVALGTHPLKNTYIGNSRIAELLRMGWRRPVDLSMMTSEELGGWDVQVWRSIVRGIVVNVEEASSLERRCPRTNLRSRAFNVVKKEGPFSEEDGLFNWDQYSSNECWICCDSSSHWDLWVSCKHSFCSTCSEEMMERVMPCPLCRTVSTAVVRRSALRVEV